MADANKVAVDTITFHYLKSPQFRVVHVDGLIGGVTPRGLLHCAVFSERLAIPQAITQELQPGGVVGSETGRVGKEGVARELEADLIMDVRTARAFHRWLEDRIKELEDAQAALRPSKEKPE